jgi:hypothetical protein
LQHWPAYLINAISAAVQVSAVALARTFAKMEGGAAKSFLEERNNVDIFWNQNIIVSIKA